MEKKLSIKELFAIGLMLFALFFGAGNMIFPPALGQAAGTNVWVAIVGFLITGVGLPLLAVSAIARAGGDLQTLASRAHPLFGVIFTIVMYLAIGPLFAIPRTGTVSFEIGVTPFLSEELKTSNISLGIYTVLYFSLTLWLSINPSKLVDRIGKLLTPVLLGGLAVLIGKSIITPIGEAQAPTAAYAQSPFFKGFVDGYLTMDAIAALVFGIIVINAIKDKGVSENKAIASLCIKAGLIAAAGLAFIYVSLAYIGASSVDAIGYKDNGGAIITLAATHLFGKIGNAILSIIITLACLTTSVGLLSSCASYFSKLTPNISYKTYTIVMSIFSAIIANVGLTNLIKFSIPVLIIIYPLAIVLVALSFLHEKFNGRSEVYSGALLAAGFVSIFDGLNNAGMNVKVVLGIFEKFLPLFSQGIGWLVPAIIGALLGWIMSKMRVETNKKSSMKNAS
jgi:branched-chain amino acid:cation transporter, LIVCS family